MKKMHGNRKNVAVPVSRDQEARVNRNPNLKREKAGQEVRQNLRIGNFIYFLIMKLILHLHD